MQFNITLPTYLREFKFNIWAFAMNQISQGPTFTSKHVDGYIGFASYLSNNDLKDQNFMLQLKK